jgi:hypothetical protein
MTPNRLPSRRSAFLAGGCLALAGFAALALVAAPGAAQPPTPTPPPNPPKKLTVEEYRKLYPFQSVADRLDYESERMKDSAPPRLRSEAAKRLEDAEKTLEQMSKYDVRAKSLALLHSDEAEKFIQRNGFGVERLPKPSVRALELPPAPTVSFAAPKEPLDPANEKKVSLPKADRGAGGAAQMPSLELLGTFHLRGEMNFLNLTGFGYVQDREHVAGFQAHQFRSFPQWGAGPSLPREEDREKEHWLVARLELVSLLKQKEPAVYVATELPRMEELKKGMTRPPMEFETQALKALRDGEDLVSEATTNHIRMMGALRASKQCLECHQVRRGDLLGAFSYDLLRDPPLKTQ